MSKTWAPGQAKPCLEMLGRLSLKKKPRIDSDADNSVSLPSSDNLSNSRDVSMGAESDVVAPAVPAPATASSPARVSPKRSAGRAVVLSDSDSDEAEEAVEVPDIVISSSSDEDSDDDEEDVLGGPNGGSSGSAVEMSQEGTPMILLYCCVILVMRGCVPCCAQR